MRGREWGGEERMAEAVDLPVAMLPVRAMRSMLVVGLVVVREGLWEEDGVRRMGRERGLVGCFEGKIEFG
jgi:hypothetical protein